jgi:hypothetical protein
MPHCEDCGTRLQGGRCPNCHEEIFIRDQYIEIGIPMPDDESEFMKKVQTQEWVINENERNRAIDEVEELRAKERNRKRWPKHYE